MIGLKTGQTRREAGTQSQGSTGYGPRTAQPPGTASAIALTKGAGCMWQERMALANGEGSAARRTIASGFVLSGTDDRTTARVPKPTGR
jgi:hypothetical protein